MIKDCVHNRLVILARKKTVYIRKWLYVRQQWHGSNKMLSLSLSWHCHGSQADTSMSAMWMVFSSALTMVLFVLVVLIALFMGPVFFAFFKGSGYRTTRRSLDWKPCCITSCNVTVTHQENAVGLVETSDGVSRLGLGLESRFIESQVSSWSQRISVSRLCMSYFFMKSCKKQLLKNGFIK